MNQHSEHGAVVLNNGRRMFLRLAALGAGVSLLAATLLVPEARAVDPCCGVLSLDRARGVVTAFERASGNIFSFSVKDQALLSSFKPCQAFDTKLAGVKAGQAFPADLGGVSGARMNPAEPLNEMRKTPRTDRAAGGRRVAPCCELTGTPGTAGRVLGVQPHVKFEGVEILLTELKRTGGDLVTATCLYCNGGAARIDLAGDLRARGQGKAKLLDTANKLEYQVESPGGHPLVSDHGPGLKLQPHQAVKTWMKFTAPAGDTATLIVPGASEPFENVPIAK